MGLLVLALILGAAAGVSVQLVSVASAAQGASGAPLPLPITVSTPSLTTISLPSVTVTTPTLPVVNVSTTVTTPSAPSVTVPRIPTTTTSVPQVTIPSTRTLPSVTDPAERSTPPARTGPRRQATGVSTLTSRPRTTSRAGSPRRQATAAVDSPRRPRAAGHRPASAPDAGRPTPAKPGSVARRTPNLLDRIGSYVPLPLPIPDWSKPIILALALLCLGLGVRTGVTSRRARRLQRSHRALTEDVDAMQPALVPEIPARLGALAISVAYRPADGPGAGGDFYDAFALVDGRVVIILGDVSGHGRSALAHAARMRYTLRAYAEAGLAPREVLKLAGRSIGTNLDDLYTTVAIAVHDTRAGALTYASAGHPPPLFAGRSVHEPLTVCASPPLGWGIPSGRRQTTVPFANGSRACLFSDGLIEARANRQMLGREGLAMMFAEVGGDLSARTLLDQVREFAPQVRDDMAACVIEAADGRTDTVNPAWLEELELDLDQLNCGQGQRFLTACGLTERQIGHALSELRSTVLDNGIALVTVSLPEGSWSVSPPARLAIAPSTTPPLVPVA